MPDVNKKKNSSPASTGGNSSSIFGTSIDRVCVVSRDKNGPYFKITIQPTSGENEKQISNTLPEKFHGIVTEVSIEQAARTEWAHTLGNQIFAYTFGEALYDLSVQGIGFATCTNQTKNKKESDTATDPMAPLLNFYRDNNIAKDGKYCTVVLGKTTYKAYLVSGSVSASVASGISVWPFNFKFKAIRSKNA